MLNMLKYRTMAVISLFSVAACTVPKVAQRAENRNVPLAYSQNADTTNMTAIPWRQFFSDPFLVSLIDTALRNNQELMSTLQEIEIARNELRARKGNILPTVGLKAGAGVEKVGRYTSQGAGDASTEMEPGKPVPDALGDFTLALNASWEADIWKKLRTAKKAAVSRYLATVEGKNFLLTSLIAEVANSYYELLSLDNQLEIVRQNIALQENALEIVKVQKEAAKATELAVQKFAAEVLKSQSLEFDIQQQIRETENRINLLVARFPREISREHNSFLNLEAPSVHAGTPMQLLSNRPDIHKAELELEAAKLDVAVARKEFYPALGMTAGAGFSAFRPDYLVKLPESLLYSLAGELVGPLINRNKLKAEYYSANARQRQAVFNYERVILNAYLEVSTQLSKIDNLQKSYDLKSKQVAALTRSIDISNDLFKSARADYLEVLMTQRDALEARLELIETKRESLNAVVNIYRDLGGGWK